MTQCSPWIKSASTQERIRLASSPCLLADVQNVG